LSVYFEVGSKVRTGDPFTERLRFLRSDEDTGFQRRLDILDKKGFQAGYICIPAFDIAGQDNVGNSLDKGFPWRLGECEQLDTALKIYSGRREFIVISASAVNFSGGMSWNDVIKGGRRYLVGTEDNGPTEDIPMPNPHRRALRDGCRAALKGVQRKAIPSSLAPALSADTYYYGFHSGLYDSKKFRALCNVMMIERKGNIAYRLAIGQVHTDALWEAKPQRKTVILG
jgi:hypothetical protein